MYNMPGLPGEPSIEDVGMQTRGRIRFAPIRHLDRALGQIMAREGV
jgi:hypothetical protein